MLLWSSTYGVSVPNSVFEKIPRTREEVVEMEREIGRRDFDMASGDHSVCGCPAPVEVHVEWDEKPSDEFPKLKEGDRVTRGLILGRFLGSCERFASPCPEHETGHPSILEERIREKVEEASKNHIPKSRRWLVDQLGLRRK